MSATTDRGARGRGPLRRKSVEASLASVEDPERHLRRELTAWDLAVLGVAVAIGAGIFSVGATAAADYAGPGVILSYAAGAVIALLIAFWPTAAFCLSSPCA